MIKDILTHAAKYLGTPYVWGGESMSDGGFDCSGYVFNVLDDSGYKVARDTAQGYYNRFKNNEIKAVEAGALLFFGKSKSKITHVAIAASSTTMYESIGGMLNTKYNKGKGVTLSNISRRSDLIAICTVEKQTTAESYYPKYTGASTKLDHMLYCVGAPYGSVKKRTALANVNGIENYSGTYDQNIKLIKLVKAGLLRRFNI